jgi:fermentation-respiration switch protein FrsA (DUF1100 family)
MSSSWIYLALLFGCVFCLLFAFYPHVENFFIFHPQAQFDAVPSDLHLNFEDVYFKTEDDKKLHGWFFPVEDAVSTLLLCHGNAGNISHRLDNVRLLLDQKIQVFIFDYRGYGRSTGRPSEIGIYRDGLAAYDFLVHTRHIRPDRIIPFGRSLGASVAIEISLRRAVRSLIVESGFTSTKEMAKGLFPFGFFSFLLPPHYNNVEKLPQVKVPKLIIHGDKDEIVPFSMGQTLYQSAGPPKYFLPLKGAGHNDTYIAGGRKYFEALTAFADDSKI